MVDAAVEGLAQEAILDWAAVSEQFDQDAFMRDGVAVLRGVMTPAATRRLRASCERVQELNDEWLDHDWLEPAQWEQMGWRPPTCEPLSEEEKAKARGASQVLNSVLGRIWRSARENNAEATPGNPNFVRDSHSIRHQLMTTASSRAAPSPARHGTRMTIRRTILG